MILEKSKSRWKAFICSVRGHDYGDEQEELIHILLHGRVDLGLESQQYDRYALTKECTRCGQIVGSFLNPKKGEEYAIRS